MDTSKLTPGFSQQLALNLELDEEMGDVSNPALTHLRKQVISETARETLDEINTAWMADYKRLRDDGWPWRVAVYIAWSASPKRSRVPATQDELAINVLGLTSDRAIATWRKKNPAIDEMVALLQALPLLEHRRDIYEALIESAASPDHRSHQDRKLALELLGDYVSKSQVSVKRSGDVDDLSTLSDEELDQLARGLLKRKELDDNSDAAEE